MGYEETYQLAITYEIEPTMYEQERKDFTFFEWLSGIGGVGFLFRLSNFIVKVLDSPDMFVTDAMLAQSNMLRRSSGSNVSIQSRRKQ